MSEPVIRMHRSTADEDMHERLRRLLYEAFFGVDFDGAAARSPQHNERPRLLLVSPSRRGAMRPDVRSRAAASHTTDAPGASAADRCVEDATARPAGVPEWSRPKLERMP
jgi:hypothetical protein